MRTTATKFSIADPHDPLAMDVAGFSAEVPQFVSAFLTGNHLISPLILAATGS